jgi:hypothetical protein
MQSIYNYIPETNHVSTCIELQLYCTEQFVVRYYYYYYYYFGDSNISTGGVFETFVRTACET